MKVVDLIKAYTSVTFLTMSFNSCAQLSGNFVANGYTKEEKREIILKTKQLITENYVIVEKIKAINQCMDKFANSKECDTISTKLLFRRALSYQLRKSSNDLHFTVFPIFNNADEKTDDKTDTTYGIKEIRFIKDSIGYLKFNYFPPLNDTTKKAFSAAFDKLKNARAFILDLTDNYGGNPYFEAHLCSYFFMDSTHLYDVYSRKDDSLYQFWTSKYLLGSGFRDNIRLFVLTSEKTFSAGEALAYDLQARKRAKVVGQQTAGGANPGASFFINDKLKVFIPVSKTINFTTKSNWEGIGVKPDIATLKHKEIDEVLNELKRSH